MAVINTLRSRGLQLLFTAGGAAIFRRRAHARAIFIRLGFAATAVWTLKSFRDAVNALSQVRRWFRICGYGGIAILICITAVWTLKSLRDAVNAVSR